MSSQRPNILLITTDQQRFDTIAALGNRSILTPHLDWLSDQGITFTRAYSDCPLCGPARVSIMTGRHGWSHGVMSNVAAMQGMQTLPGLLSAGGYQTRATGKMHFTPMRAHYGFEHMEILPDYHRFMEKNYPQYRPKDHGIGENEMHPVFSTVPESFSITRWIVERSNEFLETRDDTRPFFMWTSFSKPHPPFDAPKNYWDLYENIPMPEPVYGDWSQSVEDVPPAFMGSTWSLNNIHRFTPEQRAASCRAYYACITQIDYNLGVLFGRLRELGHYENTWIIFASDHGEMMGDHHMGAKSLFFEGSAHVPMIVRPPDGWDEIPRGTRCDAITCLADILPTCLHMAGMQDGIPQNVDGISLLEQGAGKAQRDCLFGAGSGDSTHMLLEQKYKYCFSPAGGAELLFDMDADPMEQRNLAGEAGSAEQLDSMRVKLCENLTARNHPAAEGRALHSTGEPLTEKEVQSKRSWPGFHTTRDHSEVLH